jgi:EAL domain-containing protein (putative c-di-GMP-specific phosphodiesterase class I)
VLTGERSKEHHLQRTAQIIAHLRSLTYELLGRKMTLKVSIGVSYLENEQGSANTVLLHAEQAYDSACLQGGDITIEYEAPKKLDEEPVNSDINFKQGLPTDSLSISYQPMISLEEQNIEHYEALIRWRTETDELIPAAKFLHYIEHSSMRIELDRWVLQTAVGAVVDDSNTRESANLFVHLSEETLQQKSFFSFAANVLRSSRLRGDRRVVFMIAEPWLSMNGEQGAIIIKALQDIRCGTCLIQAGSTEHSEKFINSFHFDYIKLAPRLTTNLDTSPETMSELKKITTIAKAARSQIIATQVEDSRNLSTLWMQGVRLFQGFFIQSPEQEFNTSAHLEFYEADHKKF